MRARRLSPAAFLITRTSRWEETDMRPSPRSSAGLSRALPRAGFHRRGAAGPDLLSHLQSTVDRDPRPGLRAHWLAALLLMEAVSADARRPLRHPSPAAFSRAELELQGQADPVRRRRFLHRETWLDGDADPFRRLPPIHDRAIPHESGCRTMSAPT